jgi:hypothetical protein
MRVKPSLQSYVRNRARALSNLTLIPLVLLGITAVVAWPVVLVIAVPLALGLVVSLSVSTLSLDRGVLQVRTPLNKQTYDKTMVASARLVAVSYGVGAYPEVWLMNAQGGLEGQFTASLWPEAELRKILTAFGTPIDGSWALVSGWRRPKETPTSS